MKATGQDIIDFFNEWPPGKDVFYEDVPFTENAAGVLCETNDFGDAGALVDPTGVYEWDAGYLGWQGHGASPVGFDDDFNRVFKKWKKTKTTTTFAVEIPNEGIDAFKAASKASGWKIRT